MAQLSREKMREYQRARRHRTADQKLPTQSFIDNVYLKLLSKNPYAFQRYKSLQEIVW